MKHSNDRIQKLIDQESYDDFKKEFKRNVDQEDYGTEQPYVPDPHIFKALEWDASAWNAWAEKQSDQAKSQSANSASAVAGTLL